MYHFVVLHNLFQVLLKMEGADSVDFFEKDTTCTVSPYFEIHEGKENEWKENTKKFLELTKKESDVVHYGFSYTSDGRQVHCREAYTSGKALLHHLKNVDGPLNTAMKLSTLTRIEFHGPKSEIEQVREELTPLGCIFFTTDENCIKNKRIYKK